MSRRRAAEPADSWSIIDQSASETSSLTLMKFDYCKMSPSQLNDSYLNAKEDLPSSSALFSKVLIKSKAFKLFN